CTMFGAGDGRRADVGDGDAQRDARVRLPADVLARHVCAAGRRRVVDGRVGSTAACWCLDGDGEESVRARHARRRRVLPRADGTVAHMTDLFLKAFFALTLIAGGMVLPPPPVANAQDSGLTVGTQAPSAKLSTLDGKTVDLAQIA